MHIDSTDLTDLKQLMNQDDAMAREVAGTWDRWKRARSEAEARINETKQFLEATSTRETSNAGKGGVDGDGYDHSVHIPKLTQIADNLSAHYKRSLFGNRNWLEIDSRDEESSSKDKKRIIKSYLKTKHDQSGFVTTASQLLDDWILYGNCFAEVKYVDERTEREGEFNQGYTGTKLCRINPFDIVFNLQASSFDKSSKIIRRVHSMGSLKRIMEENPHEGWLTEAFERGRQLREAANSFNFDDQNKEHQQILDGLGTFMDYLHNGYVELLEFYGDFYDSTEDKLYKNQVITVMDRRYVLRMEEIQTWSGKPYIFHCGWRIRPDTLWAMSPLENLVGMQYMINHLRNGIADATDLILYPQKVIKGSIQEPDDDLAPAAKWYDPEGDGQVDFIRPDTSFLSADFQIDKLEAQMEAYAGSPRETMGIRTAGEKTAFEVETLREAALGVFQHRITYFEDTILKQIVNAEIELARLNMSADTIKVINDENGIETFMSISSEDLTSTGQIIPVGASHFVERAQKVQELQGLFQMLAQDPSVQRHFSSIKLAKDVEEALGKDPQSYVTENIRISEEQQAASLQNQAARNLEQEEIDSLGADFTEEELASGLQGGEQGGTPNQLP